MIATGTAGAQSQTASPAAVQLLTQPTGAPQLQEGLAALRAGEPEKALAIFTQRIAADPSDAAANLLAATAAIALYQPADAVRYAERAHALEPANWKVHTTLVTAYSMAGDAQHRDAERAILEAAHNNPALPDARGTNGYLLDLFREGRYSVEAIDYFKPFGRYNTYFRFIVRNAAGAHVWTIEANSDSLNQSSWAMAYPKQAKEGQRQFQLESGDSYPHVDYRSFSGAPGYDYIKSQVVKVLAAQKDPFPGEPAPAATAPVAPR
ncbi:hypothetical protein D1Y84_15350 [Acidipila sp. EB88]|nr:hypothetical protein D1Y84_15350 [Acidipila sp. EB88]